MKTKRGGGLAEQQQWRGEVSEVAPGRHRGLVRKPSGEPAYADEFDTPGEAQRFCDRMIAQRTRPRARKLVKPAGPFRLPEKYRDGGKDRHVDATLTNQGVTYRVGDRQFFLPHPVGIVKAMAIDAGANIDPRNGAVRRGMRG
jgi:hypothetical protein